ncbi:MAG: hypothetical protein IT285_05595 [Bdellovibrionales bacterium]|nr:hypothetical protein [Bdellovibrionales bacterium]
MKARSSHRQQVLSVALACSLALGALSPRRAEAGVGVFAAGENTPPQAQARWLVVKPMFSPEAFSFAERISRDLQENLSQYRP